MKEVEVRLEKVEDYDSYNYYSYDILADEKVIGFAAVMAVDEDDDHAYCEWIVIDEDVRNQGYGTKAIQKLSDIWSGIEVSPDNADAQRLWARLGNEIDSYTDQGFGSYRI